MTGAMLRDHGPPSPGRSSVDLVPADDVKPQIRPDIDRDSVAP